MAARIQASNQLAAFLALAISGLFCALIFHDPRGRRASRVVTEYFPHDIRAVKSRHCKRYNKGVRLLPSGVRLFQQNAKEQERQL